MDREQELVQRIAIIKQTGNRLIELVRPEFPKVLERTAPEHRLAQIALLARMTGTMEAILHVAQLRREADLAVLLRVLLDHTIVLAWLAIDPDTNYPLWKTLDARQRLKIHNEWQRRWNRELLTPDRLAVFERIAAESHLGPTELVDRAIAADKYWTTRVGFSPEEAPFVDHYQTTFRHSSSRVHASWQGMNDVIAEAPDHVIVALERSTGNQAVAGRAVSIYALGLKVSAATNGIPRPEDVEAVMANYVTKRWSPVGEP
jgi:hypothetical protein